MPTFKRILSGTLATLMLTPALLVARSFTLSSPDKKIVLSVDAGERIKYNVSFDGKQVIADSYLRLETRNGIYGYKPSLSGSKISSVDEVLTPVAAIKSSKIRNNYNQLILDFRDGFSLDFRVFDDGVAYRFVTKGKGTVDVLSEEFALNFPKNYKAHLQQTGDFRTNYEEPYKHIGVWEWKPSDKIATLPALFTSPEGVQILVGESAVKDYPHMFLRGRAEDGVAATFPKYPARQTDDGDDHGLTVRLEADYIARTNGGREYPWRYFTIVPTDNALIGNTMTARLAPESAINDPSWIKPGQVAWEWWSGAVPYGPEVDFEAGLNTATYKYFIDFASEFKIPYVLMDHGWERNTLDPLKPNPDVDVAELIRYGNEKGVGIVLWVSWIGVHRNPAIFDLYRQWGVKGVKMDYMNRSDQWMVNFYENTAAEAAKNNLFVVFHGSFKPAGLEYEYPNVLSYEGVLGMEHMGTCRPQNSVWLPLIRNVAGPMDYTPGAMYSTQPEVFASSRPNVASIGTRAYQMALYIIFESGFQMLSDNPVLYRNNRECTDFIASVPVTWDETVSPGAKAGEWVAIAKRKGDKWFMGAMNGTNEPQWRDVEVDLDFLDEGRTYKMTWFEDGINAPRQAMDYRRKSREVKKGDKVTLRMARNGGWAGTIE